MNKYFFELDKLQLEKPTEPKYVFCAPARTWAVAENEEEARLAALAKLRAKYHGTGVILGSDLRLTNQTGLPTDWNYGYGDDRLTGTEEDRSALWQACTK